MPPPPRKHGPGVAQGRRWLLTSPGRCRQAASSHRGLCQAGACGNASRAAAFPRFFHLHGRFPACSLGGGSLNRGYRYQGVGKRDARIDQCVWAGNWDLREPVTEQAGMDFHPRGKARALPCSVSPRETLGKLAWAGAQRWEFGARAGSRRPRHGHRSWLAGADGCGAAAPQADGVPGKYRARVYPRAGSCGERGAGRFAGRCWGRGWMRPLRAG